MTGESGAASLSATPQDAPGAALLCRQRKLWIAFPVAHVIETMRPLPIEPLPGMPVFTLGVAVIRGAAVPVVDAAALLGSTDGANAGRWVMLRAGERRIALAVEAVEGVVEIAADRRAHLPPLLKGANADVISAVGTLDAELLVSLRAASLLSEDDWQTFARREPGS